MVIEIIFNMIFGVVEFIITLLPKGMDLPTWTDNLVGLVAKGLIFFPQDVWAITIGNIAFWLSAHMIWAVIEWVYKKIPGVD